MTLRQLEGKVDIYLPDLKYADGALAKALSGAEDYFPAACGAIREMFRQVGRPVYDENGLMKQGVILRHLVLPGYLNNTRQVLDWIAETFAPGDVAVIADKPVYAAGWHDGPTGAAGDGGGVPGGSDLYAELRH